MAFDINGARKAGYSDDDIAEHLGAQSGFDVKSAMKAGYSLDEVAEHISKGKPATPTPEATQQPQPQPAQPIWQPPTLKLYSPTGMMPTMPPPAQPQPVQPAQPVANKPQAPFNQYADEALQNIQKGWQESKQRIHETPWPQKAFVTLGESARQIANVPFEEGIAAAKTIGNPLLSMVPGHTALEQSAQSIPSTAAQGVSGIAGMPLVAGGTTTLGDAFKPVVDYASSHPGQLKTLGDFVNIGMVLGGPVAGLIENAIPHIAQTELAQKVAPDMAKSIVENAIKKADETATEQGAASVISGQADNVAATTAKDVQTKQLDKAIQEGVDKGIKPTVVGKPSYNKLNVFYDNASEAVKTIVENKDAIKIVDDDGEEIARPKTAMQMAQAIEQAKKAVYEKYHGMALAAGEEGATISTQPVMDKLDEIAPKILDDGSVEPLMANDPRLKYNPDTRKYALDLKNEIAELNNASPEIVEARIADLNNSLKGFYEGRTVKAKAEIDGSVAQLLRQQLDDKIANATGEGYQALKGQYGALKAIENEVAKRALVNARRNAKGVFDLTDVFTGGELISGLLTMNPALVAKGAAGMAIKDVLKSMNNPDRHIDNMFKKAYEYEGYKPKVEGLRPPAPPTDISNFTDVPPTTIGTPGGTIPRRIPPTDQSKISLGNVGKTDPLAQQSAKFAQETAPQTKTIQPQVVLNPHDRVMDRTTLQDLKAKYIDELKSSGEHSDLPEDVINKLADKHAELAGRSTLTGLKSKPHFNSEMERIRTNPTPGTKPMFLSADLDYFKTFNDTHGQEYGDKVLKDVLPETNKYFKEFGLDHYHLSGDENAAITEIPFGKEKEYFNAINAIKDKFDALKIVLPNGEKVPVSMSFGISNKDYKAAEDLLKKSKAAGKKNGIVLDNDLKQKYNLKDREGVDVRPQYESAGLTKGYRNENTQPDLSGRTDRGTIGKLVEPDGQTAQAGTGKTTIGSVPNPPKQDMGRLPPRQAAVAAFSKIDPALYPHLDENKISLGEHIRNYQIRKRLESELPKEQLDIVLGKKLRDRNGALIRKTPETQAILDRIAENTQDSEGQRMAKEMAFKPLESGDDVAMAAANSLKHEDIHGIHAKAKSENPDIPPNDLTDEQLDEMWATHEKKMNKREPGVDLDEPLPPKKDKTTIGNVLK